MVTGKIRAKRRGFMIRLVHPGRIHAKCFAPLCFFAAGAGMFFLVNCRRAPDPELPASLSLENWGDGVVALRQVRAASGEDFTVPVPGARATVLVFSSTTCPIANGYAPELTRLENEFRPRGVTLMLVQTETDITGEKARLHAAEYHLAMPVLLDPSRKLTQAAGATVTPEAVVLSPSGGILYRGRIDDRFPDVGLNWREPQHTELRDVLTAILDGKAVPVSRTKAKGCFIE